MVGDQLALDLALVGKVRQLDDERMQLQVDLGVVVGRFAVADGQGVDALAHGCQLPELFRDVAQPAQRGQVAA